MLQKYNCAHFGYTWVVKIETVQQHSFYKGNTRYYFSNLKSTSEMLADTEIGIVKSDSKNDAIGLSSSEVSCVLSQRN